MPSSTGCSFWLRKVIGASHMIGGAIGARAALAGQRPGHVCRRFRHTMRNAQFDQCIKAFSETDLTEDLKKIDVPMLVMQCEDDSNAAGRRAGNSHRTRARRPRLRNAKARLLVALFCGVRGRRMGPGTRRRSADPGGNRPPPAAEVLQSPCCVGNDPQLAAAPRCSLRCPHRTRSTFSRVARPGG